MKKIIFIISAQIILSLSLSMGNGITIAQQSNPPDNQASILSTPEPRIEETYEKNVDDLSTTDSSAPYNIFDENLHAIQLIPESDVFAVNLQSECISAETSLDSELSNTTGTKELIVYKNSGFSIIQSSSDLSEAEIRSISSVINSQLQNQCVSPVFRQGDDYFFAQNEIIVKFSPQLSTDDIQKIIEDLELEIEDDELGGSDLYLLKTSNFSNGDVFAVTKFLIENGFAEIADPDFYFFRISDLSKSDDKANNDISESQLDLQWNLRKIRASEAWDLLSQAGISTYSKKIAVIDTGIQRAHEDLGISIDPIGYDAANDVWSVGAGEPKGQCPHGTSVAGIIAALPQNGLGTDGVGKNFVQVVPVNSTNSDCDVEKVDWLYRAIMGSANRNDVSVINLSWGSTDLSLATSLNTAIDYATSKGCNGHGCVFVAASGNTGIAEVSSPASYYKSIAVGGTGYFDTRKTCLIFCNENQVWSSNYGLALDITAPGGDSTLTLTYIDKTTTNAYSNRNGGTSLSAPEVAAVAAMMLAVNPNLTPFQVQDILQRTAAKVGGVSYNLRKDEGGWNEEMGFGRLDAAEAVRAALPQNAPKLSFSIKLERVTSSSNHAVNVAIGVFGKYQNASSGYYPLLFEGTMSTNASGNSNSNLQISGLATGNYMVCAKPEHYLWRCLPATLTTGGTTSIDFSSGGSYSFLSGDFSRFGEDGVINSQDIEVFRAGYNNCVHISAVGSCAPYDLLRDGQINSGDWSVQQVNYGHSSDGWEYGSSNWRPFKSTQNQSIAIDSLSSSTTTSGSVWLESAKTSYSVGDSFDVHIMMDLSNLSIGAGSSNLILRYDPGVLEVIDSFPAIDGIQIKPGTLFPSSDYGVVDSTKGEIRFGALEGSSATAGISAVGELATVTFQVTRAMNQTKITPYWISNESKDSNASEFGTGNDVITSASGLYLHTYGLISRFLPFVEISIPQSSYIGTNIVQITINANDMYDQVEYVDGMAFYNNSWNDIGSATRMTDGWNLNWNTMGITDQIIYLQAHAVLPGGQYGSHISSAIVLDRTPPTYSTSSFTPCSPAWPTQVEVYVSATDNLSGVASIDMYINDATDGSNSGNWVYIDQISGPSGTITWNTSGMNVGLHQIAFAIQDAAGNWNRWSDPSLPTIVYGQSSIYIPVVQRP